MIIYIIVEERREKREERRENRMSTAILTKPFKPGVVGSSPTVG